MPIRIPQTLAQGTPDLGGTPRFAMSDAEQPGLQAVNQAIAQTATSVTKGLTEYQKINDALSKEEMKLDVEDKLMQVKDRLAQEDIKLRQEGVDPDTLPETFRQRGQAAIAEVSGDLRYPQSAAKFQGEANQLLGAAVIKQRYEGLKLKNARIGVLSEIQNTEDVNTAVFAEDPAVRDAAIGRINARVDSLVATGVWDQSKAESTTKRLLDDISVGRAQRAFQDPERRAIIIDQMLNGQLKYVDPEKQMNLAHTWQKQMQEQDKLRETQFNAWWEREQEQNILQYSQLATDKKLTVSDLQRNATQWQWKATEYDRVFNILTAPPREDASDPNTRARVLADAHSQYPTLSERAILDLKANGKLNTTDALNAIDHRRSTIQHLQNEAKSDTERAYAQGKQRIKASLGIPDIMDRVDDPRMGVWSLALDEYDRLAAGARGKGAPEKVSDDIVVKYRPLLGERINESLSNAQSLLRYNSMTELKAAKPRISTLDYDTQERLLIERDRLAKEAQKQKDQADAQKNAPGLLERLKGMIPGLGAPPPANLR